MTFGICWNITKQNANIKIIKNRQIFIRKKAEKDLELLETYFSHDMSLKATCEELYLHKNTLQYKLDKIHKITGYNPRNFKNAVVLYIGLKLLKLEWSPKY